MASKETILTADGLKKLQEELAQRKGEIREEIVERLKEARAQGDLSENAGYRAARRAQGKAISRIKFLQKILQYSRVIDTSALPKDRVSLLSRVEFTNLSSNVRMTYTIVSESEANLREGKISITTPIAQGLLNHKVGDEVEIKIPRGTIHLRIDKITVE